MRCIDRESELKPNRCANKWSNHVTNILANMSPFKQPVWSSNRRSIECANECSIKCSNYCSIDSVDSFVFRPNIFTNCFIFLFANCIANLSVY